MSILALDPSGSFKYGKGKTGIVYAKDGIIKMLISLDSKKYKTREEYFEGHIDIIKKTNPEIIIMENFILYTSSRSALTNQELETPELIGYITKYAKDNNIKIVRQNAHQIKGILTTKPNVLMNILEGSGIFYKESKNKNILWYKGWYEQTGIYKEKRLNNHIMDAVRHLIYYLKYDGR